VKAFFSADFEAGRHKTRVDQITEIEKAEAARKIENGESATKTNSPF
jgi:ribose 5-phosphate isomerase RpiB